MRIIGGELGGRRISAPKGAATRPTSDRVREALFSILNPPPPACEVLDLFAGAGCLGLEALSRGASRVVFVDSSRAATRALRHNIASLGVDERAAIVCAAVSEALVRPPIAPRSGATRSFDWIFIDPPYASDLGVETLSRLGAAARGELVSPRAVVILEHDRRHPSPLETGCLVRTDHRRYGDTELSFYRRRDRP